MRNKKGNTANRSGGMANNNTELKHPPTGGD
jgi:hypothetical protein